MEEEDLQAVRAHNHLVEQGEELVHYIREKERQESQECVWCVCEREGRGSVSDPIESMSVLQHVGMLGGLY